MSLVTYELEDHVATITLNRPEARNAINGPLRRTSTQLGPLPRRQDAWVGILTANGSVFCAGGDLKDGEGSVGTFGGTFWEKPTINSFESGMELFKPTIAAVHGPCIGYGLTGVLVLRLRYRHHRGNVLLPRGVDRGATIVGAIRLPQTRGLGQCHGAASDREADERRAGQGGRPGLEARRTRRAAGRGSGVGPDPHRGRTPGPAGDQRSGMANRRHGLDRVGPLR